MKCYGMQFKFKLKDFQKLLDNFVTKISNDSLKDEEKSLFTEINSYYPIFYEQSGGKSNLYSFIFQYQSNDKVEESLKKMVRTLQYKLN